MPVAGQEAGSNGPVPGPSAAPPPLVEAKTARPQLVRSHVDRQRLIDLLDAAMSTPVTLVCAGAG